MADEIDRPAEEDELEQEGGPGQTSEPDSETDGDGEEAEEPLPRVALEVSNEQVIGRLVLHFPERDVALLLDGASALRTLEMVRLRRGAGLADVIDVFGSPAHHSWFVFNPGEPLAASWIPGVPRERAGVAVDPVPPSE